MFVIDASSLITLTRYYFPFDRDMILFNAIEKRIESKNIVVIDKVYDECKYTLQKIVTKNLPYLEKKQTSTLECLPDRTFFHFLNNGGFFNPDKKKELTPLQVEQEKANFLAGLMQG